MCRALSAYLLAFFGLLMVPVFVNVLAAPPVGVYVTLIVNFSFLSFLSALLAFELRLSVIAWAPDLVTLTVLVESVTALPFFGLAEEAMLSLPGPGHWTESLIVVPLVRADGIVIVFDGGGGGGGVVVP